MIQTENTQIAYNLLFDVSNFFYRSYHSYKGNIKDFDLTKKDHQYMLVRKFVIDFVSIAKLVPVSNLFFCFDDETFRKKIDPNYKIKRSEKPEGFVETLQQIENLLKYKGLNAIKVKGLEADDCMALLGESLSHLPKIGISADEDVRQNIKARMYVLVPHLKGRKLFRSLYSIHPPKITDVETEIVYPQYILAEKLCRGCKGDDVPNLAPKGFKTTKIKSIADFYMDRKLNHQDNELNAWINAFKASELNYISEESIYTQLQLVCLQSQFMPQESVEEFNKIIFSNLRITDFTVESILRNTAYWSDNYNKKDK